MRKTICTLFLMLITVSVFAQSPTWYGQIPAYTRKSTFSTRSFVNNESAVTTRGTIRGKIVTVPSEEAGTIQEAVNLRPSTISLSPGKYDENIFIPSYMSVTIRPEIPGTVIIDGGTNGNTIYLNPEASVVLENLIILNSQSKKYYDTAAVFGWGGVNIAMTGCTVFTANIGVSSSYASTFLAGNRFIGLNDNAVGALITYHSGAKVFDSLFANLLIGIDTRNSLNDIQPVIRCQGNCGDSNSYTRVASTYLQ
jgi:hypothetical protein